MRISNYALGNRQATFAFIGIIIIFGISSYSSLPRESAPDIVIPFVIVTTLYFGTSPEDIETSITLKLEKELADIDNIKEMVSNSGEGISNITLEFDPDEDVDDIITKVREKVDLAKPELPDDAEDPIITELNFSSFPIILVNVSGEYNLVKLKSVAEEIQDRLEQISGVLEVNLTGGLEQELQVNCDPDKMRHYKVSMLDVQTAILNENINIPGGNVNIGKYSYLLRIPGEVNSPEEIGNFIVKADDHFPIYIKDVATIEFGFKDISNTARMEGLDCITMGVTKRSGENIIRIASEVREIVNEILPSLPATTRVNFTSDQSKDIRMMVDELENGIMTGLVLVVTVLMFFLGFRTSILVAISIPLSMLLSFVVIDQLGYTLNMVVLFSLILALGMLVDNAIVIVENIYRFREEGKSASEAAKLGVGEVGWAVIASTATTLCAFFPMIFWPGIMGEFMKFLPITLIITLSSSLLIGLVINPVVCATFLKVSKKKIEIKAAKKTDGRVMTTYKLVLNWALDHRFISMFGALASLVLAMVIYGFFGTGVEFFPKIDPKKVFADFEHPSGTRIATTDAMLQDLEEVLPRWENIQTYVAQSGISLADMDMSPGSGPANKGRISIDMIDREFRLRSSRETMAEIREAVKDYAGADATVKEMNEGPPTGNPVNIEIVGKELSILAEIAQDFVDIIKEIPGIVNLQMDFDGAKPQVRVNIDRAKAAYLGVNTAMIGSLIRTAIKGSETGYYRIDGEEFDITVRHKEDSRQSIESIEDIHIVIDDGEMVPLSSVATVEISTGLAGITRKDQSRVITVFSDVEGRLSPEVLSDVKGALADYDLPPGYTVKFTGEQEEQDAAAAFLKKAFMIAVLSIMMVLLLQFRSFVTPLVIIFGVVLSLVGVFIGLVITRLPFGIIMTGVGVISLAGVVVNNSIVLLDYTIKLRERGLAKREAIIEAGTVRFRPVLLTAVTTILGLTPMAVGISFDFKKFQWIVGSDSSQWWGGMAVAVIFGHAFATFLTLVLVPVMYSLADGLSWRMKAFWGRFNIVNMD